ncbi:hypothetical protein [Flammeovirga sp. EKP202]|uniref:hypothetical protein n=1 Tax=Flammeovirga sp. EKP202 TaxID=2770592 RepID=UPI00165F9C13|nr:hypothetical protein [Flammeovirga sp. EKP202]MBD0401484.1 hypothetical protein [Flammeovirga sp. EKP202]
MNVDSEYMFGETVEYFVWKKYGIIPVREIEMSREDSCYYQFLREYLIESKGEALLDSVRSVVDDRTSNTSLLAGLKYDDGAYSFLLNARPINGSGASILNEGDYNALKESISSLLQKKTKSKGELSFWITINKSGQLDSVEVMNAICIDGLQKILTNRLNKITWIPAIYNDSPVNYRYKETTTF